MYHPQHDSSDPPRRGIRANGSASVGELREFLAQMRGKPPQEVLGIIAQSGLARGLILSTLIMALLVLAGTAVPFAWSKMTSEPEKQGPAAAAPKEPEDDGDEAKNDETTTADAKAKEKTDPKEAILHKLGIDETKKAPKDFNPLEDTADDIFKDLKP